MREELQKREGKRGKFSCTVQRFGSRTSGGYYKQTLLVTDVRDELGNQVTDHLWFTVGKQIRDLNLQPGEQIEFVATVRPYRKGYRGRRDDIEAPPPSTDYGLKFPREFKRKGKTHADVAGMPLFTTDDTEAHGGAE